MRPRRLVVAAPGFIVLALGSAAPPAPLTATPRPWPGLDEAYEGIAEVDVHEASYASMPRTQRTRHA